MKSDINPNQRQAAKVIKGTSYMEMRKFQEAEVLFEECLKASETI